MYFINTSLTVNVQRVLFSVLFSSDIFGSGIYLFHMTKKKKEKRTLVVGEKVEESIT